MNSQKLPHPNYTEWKLGIRVAGCNLRRELKYKLEVFVVEMQPDNLFNRSADTFIKP